MNAPPAEGARVAWHDVPQDVRGAIEQVCGAPVVEARTQPGGFSPGVAARVQCANGAGWFVKAASADTNPDAPRMHRQEARILEDLDPLIAAGLLPAPRLRGTAERGPWFALIIEDMAGRQPILPWRADELDLVLAAIDQVSDTPPPTTAPTIADYLKTEFDGWRTLARIGDDARLDPWSRSHLRELADLEATWDAHAAGDTLLHGDIRADNLRSTRTESQWWTGRTPAGAPRSPTWCSSRRAWRCRAVPNQLNC
jgi:aminoglycoside phosphotransferase (APT) family kinase protein